MLQSWNQFRALMILMRLTGTIPASPSDDCNVNPELLTLIFDEFFRKFDKFKGNR